MKYIRNMQEQNKPNCTMYKEWMVPFLNKELKEKRTIRLLKHLDTCNECREELKIQYLVREGLSRLESGRNFDLNKDFKMMLTSERKTTGVLVMWQQIMGILICTSICFVIIVLVRSLT